MGKTGLRFESEEGVQFKIIILEYEGDPQFEISCGFLFSLSLLSEKFQAPATP